MEQEVIIKSKSQLNNKPVYCTFTDKMLSKLPVTLALFYKHKIDQTLFIKSLEKVLESYSIYSSSLTINKEEMVINNDNHGISLKTEQYPLMLEQSLESLHTHAHQDSLTNALILVKKTPDFCVKMKLNYYSDGCCLVVSWHHAIGDLHSMSLFLKALSNEMHEQVSDAPIIIHSREQYLIDTIPKNKATASNLRYLSVRPLMSFMNYLIFKAKKQHQVSIYFSDTELTMMKKSIQESIECDAWISSNDALSAHLASVVNQLDGENQQRILATTLNYRPHANLPNSLIGNMITSINIPCHQDQNVADIAQKLRQSVMNFKESHFDFHQKVAFIESVGGHKKISRIVPDAIDPINGNLTLTNWSKFGILNLTFGGSKAVFFSPLVRPDFPWVWTISEGAEGQGLTVTANVPTSLAKKMISNEGLALLHFYKPDNNSKPELMKNLPWLY